MSKKDEHLLDETDSKIVGAHCSCPIVHVLGECIERWLSSEYLFAIVFRIGRIAHNRRVGPVLSCLVCFNQF